MYWFWRAWFYSKYCSAKIAEAIDAIMQGDTWVPEVRGRLDRVSDEEQELARKVADLTPQQHRVSTGRRGLLNKQIAYQLNITGATVKLISRQFSANLCL